jgi:hypothetical protein
MRYGKIENGVITQIQLSDQEGFVLVPDDAVCGMVDNLDGTFSCPPLTLEKAISLKISDIESLFHSKILAIQTGDFLIILWNARNTHIANVKGLSTTEEVQAYNHTEGWN